MKVPDKLSVITYTAQYYHSLNKLMPKVTKVKVDWNIDELEAAEDDMNIGNYNFILNNDIIYILNNYLYFNT